MPLLFLFASSVWAQPWAVDVSRVDSADALDQLLDDVVGHSPADASAVQLWTRAPDGRWVRPAQLLPDAPPVPQKETTRAAPVDHPGVAVGALTDRAVYVSQCHGWLWDESDDRFELQRPKLFDTVEDYHNPEGANQYLVRYLENAGARVFTTRERDMNPHMAIADNDGDGYSEDGTGFEDVAAGFADLGSWPYGEDPFDAGSTRRFPADGGAVATWVPEVPVDGVYHVYVAWDSDSANSTEAHYRITHPGGVIDRYYDQTVHGSTWQYVDTLWLPAGVGDLTVQLVGDSDQAGTWMSADAVRIGGGQGSVERGGGTTGRPHWESGAVLYTQYNGAPTDVYDPYTDGDGSDPSSRSRWAAWEHPWGEDAVYLSWHSNAGGGTGTSTYTYDGSSYSKVEGSDDLGQAVHDEIVDAITTLWDSDWTDRGTREAAYSELSPGNNDEMPAALVELAFHDDEYDVELLKDPRFRRDASRAMLHGIVRYFADRDGTTPHFLPEPPTHVSVVHDSEGRLVVSWEPGPSGEPYGDEADGYVLYTSADGRSWDQGVEVGGTSTTLDARMGQTVFVRVAASNAGGLSFPSEVVGARRSPDGSVPVLVVPAFDRLEVSLLPWEETDTYVGDVVRMDLSRVNPFDIAATTGRAISGAGWYFDAASDEAIEDMDLSDYALIVWLAGEESTHDESISDSQQALLQAFWEDGGALWVSGSEVLWDLDEKGSADDQAFCDAVLGARMASDDAGTSSASGEGLLAGIDLDFSETGAYGGGAPYPVEYPDVLDSSRDTIATYAGGDVAAVLGEGVAMFGFPFECVGDEDARVQVASALLPALVPDYDPPEVEDTGSPDDTGDTGDTDNPDDSGVTDDDTGFDAVPPPGELVEPPKGCGCSGLSRAAGPAAGFAWLGLFALALRRRRDPTVR